MICIYWQYRQKQTGLDGRRQYGFYQPKTPYMVAILRQDPHFLPAYHMNQTHWLTIALDNEVTTDEILKLLD